MSEQRQSIFDPKASQTYHSAGFAALLNVYSPNEGGGIDCFELDWANDGVYKNGPYHMEIGIKELFRKLRSGGAYASLRACADAMEPK